MKILLLNENPVVSRLVSLSAKKMSCDFEELDAYNENLSHYDVIVVDSDTPAPLKILKEKCERLIFLAPRNQDIDLDVQILQKPFLPTDFLNLFNDQDVKEPDLVQSLVLNNDENSHIDDDLSADLNLDDTLDDDSLNINSDNDLEDLSLNDKIEEESLVDGEKTQILQDHHTEEEQSQDQNKPNLEEKLHTIENEEELAKDHELKTPLDPNLDEISVEEQEKEMSFDDIPEDAEFLGQAKEDENLQETTEEFDPVVEEQIQEQIQDFASNLSTQDQIKEELAQLDELDDLKNDDSNKVLEDFKDEPILNEEELPTHDEELVVPHFNDFDALTESEIQEALGEEVLVKDEKTHLVKLKNDANEEIVNELSQSIAGAITSSIKGDALKAALKGMNMNININISFNED
ncbi:hypothetical protein LNU06_03430 [Campylobacter sp. VicNov18]|uniref:hypothetical protein n=1 Tax=Campylobacter bilis TaxID=2691918 RepID=UPI00130EBA9A|nr:hypothetical protein [Campylobacter bilis]MPV63192.1 hypothetical protein [Campylobacter hepaticus]MBM0636692.1 hypothetical protein [Campylobacter bilis]MCC8277536.1 hypothetical protein [Campylobacter bilis]MCC8298741.1 hypothetical protein [Campylobacter bilis]MCC8300445.1 hypothetical protein [Campylobacter bilis]